MSNEIKQGDKVRVSKDAPSMFRSGFNHVYTAYISKVLEVDDGNAIIEMTMANMQCQERIIIPTKYLVKVDAEAKEAKYRIGDRVRKKKWDKDTTISYVEWHGTWQTYVYRFAEQEYGFNCHKEEDITLVSRRAKEPKFKTGDCVKISFEWNDLPIGEKLVIERLETIDCRNAYMYSIEGYGGYVIESMLHPCTEPTEQTEQTEAEKNDADNLKKVAEEWANTVSDAIKAYGDAMCKIYVEAHNEAYWDAYTADLAKEVALKVANKFNAPHEAAEYAVSVAKAVAEGLKRK